MLITRSTIAVTGLFLFAACAQETVVSRPAAPVDWRSFSSDDRKAAATRPPTPKERDMADGYAAALQSPQLGQLASWLAPDAHGSLSGPEGVRGREQVVHLHDLLFGAFDQRAVVVTRVMSTGDTQAIEWNFTGLQARDWMLVTPTRRPVSFQGISLLWTNDDGTIGDVHVYFDEAVVKAQLGVGPRQLLDLPAAPMTVAPQRLEQMGTPVEMGNVATVRAELDALEAKDQGAYLAAMTDDVEIFTLERAEPRRGKAAVRDYYETLDRTIGQLDTTILGVWGIATFVVVEYSIAGLQLGPIGWVPMTRDHVVTLHVVDVAELRDERIARIWRYDNPLEIVGDGPF